MRRVAFTADVALTLALAVTLIVVLAMPVFAVPERAKRQADAEQLPSGGGQVTVSVGTTESGTGATTRGPGPQTAGGTTSSQGLITYNWVSTGISCWYGESAGVPVDGSLEGVIYERIRIDRTTEPPTETLTYAECFDPVEAPVIPPPPPPPPTLEEITALARELIIAPEISMSPAPEIGGVTGLETWFWHEGQEEATASVEVRGYRVTASMRPSRYYWDPDDARGGLLESTRPGSLEDPAARWMYETKGSYEVRVQVVWDGGWSFTGWGASASGDLPTIRATGSTDYRVDEVRSELTATR